MRSVAFLRAVNVGGRRATSERLHAALTGLGLTRVQAFLASGNVLFEPDPMVADGDIEGALETSLGFAVKVTSRSGPEVMALAAAEPFTDEALAASAGRPQVMLLMEPVTDRMRAAVGAAETDDSYVFSERDLHWLPVAGVSDSDLRDIHRAVGPNTIRAASTIARLAAKL